MNNHRLATILMTGFTVIFLSVGAYWYLSKQDQVPGIELISKVELTKTPTHTPTSSQVVVPSTSIPEASVTYKNKLLGDFSFQYDTSYWDSEEKSFKEPSSPTFLRCGEDCMGLRLASSDGSINLIFNISFEDNNGILCANVPNFVQLDNNWFRIEDSQGYYYAFKSDGTDPHGITLNTILNGGDCLKYEFSNGTSNTEKGSNWSCVAGTNYDLCDGGVGPFVTHTSSVSYDVNFDGASIQLVNPRVPRNTNELILRKIDQVIESITF